jgi:F0F1-type ATP synthase gamma subunit
MRSLQKVKADLDFNTELGDLLDVLKGVALSQYRSFEKRKGRAHDFMEAFYSFFQLIDLGLIDHPFSQMQGDLGIIIVNSDEGFMGDLNERVINTALKHPGGKQGVGHLKSLGYSCTILPAISQRYEDAVRLKDYIVRNTLDKIFKRLVMYYPKPFSFTVQRVEVVRILPCMELFDRKSELVQDRKDLILESELKPLIECLVETWMIEKLFQVFEESKLAELSAKTVHLEESYQEVLRQGKELQRQYRRSHHDQINRGMRDVFAARMMQKRAQIDVAGVS